jgi:23S rRNA G2445 N2-methylase RlmL
MQWPGYREGLWKLLCDEAQRGKIDVELAISGADENPEAVIAAKKNCQRCGVAGQVVIDQLTLSEQSIREGQGLVVCNPPYGKRLALGEDPEAYYSMLGQQLQRAYPNWKLAMICPDPAFVKATGLPFKQIAKLDNGGLRVGLFVSEPSE